MGQSKTPEMIPQPLCKNSGETVPLQTVPMCMYVRSFTSNVILRSRLYDLFEFE